MRRSFSPAIVSLALASALLAVHPAQAQRGAPAEAALPPESAGPSAAPAEDEFDRLLRGSPAKRGAQAPAPAAPAQAQGERAKARREPVSQIIAPRRGDLELLAAYARLRQSAEAQDRTASQAAQAELLELRHEVGAEGLEAFSAALARAAEVRLKAGDDLAAIELAKAAAELSPGLPWASWALASIQFRSDPAEVGRWARPGWQSVTAAFADPRYLRPALGDLGSAALAALVLTALVGISALFARRARYFFHDVHHLFPRAAARWQTACLAVLVLVLPGVFRLGLVPLLAALFFGVALYLDRKERAVGAVLLALLGASPLLAGALTDVTTFSGTPAEQVYRLERGGLEGAAAAKAVGAREARGEAGFPEVYALARYELRRGRLDAASELLKKAALLRTSDGRVSVLLGNARLGAGDLDGALAHYRRATELEPSLAAAHYNLSAVHYRRAATLDVGPRALELERAQTAVGRAQALDAALLIRGEPGAEELRLAHLVLTPGLPWSQVRPLSRLPGAGKQVADQLAFRLLGTSSGPLIWGLPALLALLALGLGALRERLSASRSCERCGRSVCRRCDPELPAGSALCAQCVNVFAKRGVVAPQVKIRKQLEVDRYRARTERLAWLLGVVCSGGGHLLRGVPVRGVLFAFAFLFLLVSGLLREGVLQAPYGELPLWIRLAPTAVALVAVYLLSLRSLRKAQAG